MFQKTTVLRKLQKILSGKGKKLFRNQVYFYNAVFGITNRDVFPEHLVQFMERISHEVPGSSERKEVEEFLLHGLDNSSSNVGKHINDAPGMAIPKYHCIHYAHKENRADICRRLTAAIRYTAAGIRAKSQKEEVFTELLLQLKQELSDASAILQKAEDADDVLLGVILYEIIQTHLGERHSPGMLKEETVFGKINLRQQLDEYYLTCDCYEFTSIDYFLALERMADKNVIASSNLAGFYYVGTEFTVKNEGTGPSGKYMVERNLELAAFYFRQAASSEPTYAPAAYSYGYMILHEETGNMTQEEREKEAERYYRLAAERKFHHAVSGLGDLALLRAERILQSVNLEERKPELIEQLACAIGYFDQAQQMGSFWGPIKAAQFLDNQRYQPYRKEVLQLAGLPAGDNARDRWKAAVKMGNVFAMEQLALLDLRLGYIEEAKALLESCVQRNYPNGAWHLAWNFYDKLGLEPNPEAYIRYLEKSSRDGSARASLQLGKEALKKGFDASLWFRKAEEQNLLCFENDIYEELLQYKR